jgi:hypothetical protein
MLDRTGDDLTPQLAGADPIILTRDNRTTGVCSHSVSPTCILTNILVSLASILVSRPDLGIGQLTLCGVRELRERHSNGRPLFVGFSGDSAASAVRIARVSRR